jgi:hypothetical protein
VNDRIDAQLATLFNGLDTRPGFNERLLGRLQQEIAAEARRTEEARRLEQLRHGVARSEVRPWAQAVRQWVTLETVGIAALAAIIVSSAFSTDQIREAIPVVFTVLGLALACAPAIAPVLRKRPWVPR